MAIQILATKFYTPPVRENSVVRSHLIEKLQPCVDRQKSFALLSGPAGFGKTTLLSSFAKNLKQKVAWLSLDERDNDSVRFWAHLIKACQNVANGVGQAALELFVASRQLPDDTVPTILINDLTMQDRSVTLILDDYHEIQNPSIHESMLFLVDHAPDNLCIVIATRIDLPWPLVRYRARNQLIEIRARDLRFNTTETTEFISRTMDLEMSAEDITVLAERTEGWVAGLQLAAIAMQSLYFAQEPGEIHAYIKNFSGSNIYIAEYLIEEIIQHQPEDVQMFLLQTSFLRRFTAGLCEAVTGCRDGQAKLATLHNSNNFVIPLDDEGKWFRYHHLFSDLLQAGLRQKVTFDEINALHRRAAVWYEENGLIAEAVDQFLAAKDFESVASLVERTAQTMIFNGRMNTLRDWLEAIPEKVFQNRPHLTFYLFWIDLMQEKADLSSHSIREKEDLIRSLPSSPENDRLRGRLMAVVSRAMVLSGRTQKGIGLAKEALEYIAEGDPALSARAGSALAIAYGLEGLVEEAEPVYRECLSRAISAGDYSLAAHTTMAMGLVQYDYGNLREAAGLFQSILKMDDRAGTPDDSKAETDKRFFPAGQGYIGLAGVHLERNDLATSEEYLKKGMELCRLGGLDGIFIGRIFLSRLYQAKGDLESSLEEIRLAKQAFQRADDYKIAARQIRISLAIGDVDDAANWAGPFVDMLESDDTDRYPPLLVLEAIGVVVIRVFLAQGKTEKALYLLEKLRNMIEPGRRQVRLIELNMLKALAFQKQAKGKTTPEAIDCFEKAIRLAEPEGYLLTFLEEGPAVIPLLKAISISKSMTVCTKDYACKILDTFGETGNPPRTQMLSKTLSKNVVLADPLTPREMEVLQLIAEGDSNQMISDKLFISVRTVKKHISNIIAKLNVDNRTQAAAHAREIGLL